MILPDYNQKEMQVWTSNYICKFENQIFHHYRTTKTGINAAIQLLRNHGYVIYEKQKEVSADNEWWIF